MGRADYYAPGDWNVVCFECGRKRKASMMKKNWQGYWVCPEHWEPRQPQDFVRAVPDQQTPPWVQPMPADVFHPFCSPDDQCAIPGVAIPGCVKPYYIHPYNTHGWTQYTLPYPYWDALYTDTDYVVDLSS